MTRARPLRRGSHRSAQHGGSCMSHARPIRRRHAPQCAARRFLHEPRAAAPEGLTAQCAARSLLMSPPPEEIVSAFRPVVVIPVYNHGDAASEQSSRTCERAACKAFSSMTVALPTARPSSMRSRGHRTSPWCACRAIRARAARWSPDCARPPLRAGRTRCRSTPTASTTRATSPRSSRAPPRRPRR